MRLKNALVGTGIFVTMVTNIPDAVKTQPWLVGADIIDKLYLAHSGRKETSYTVDDLIEAHPDNQSLINTDKTQLVKMIYQMYNQKWQRNYEVFMAQYNPIENFSMTQKETPNISTKHTVSDNFQQKTTTDNTTQVSVTENGGGQNNVYGFNTTNSPAPSDAFSNNKTTTTVAADPNQNKSNTTYTQNGYTEDSETGTRELTRSGNIGVTTSQQMIQSDIDLWKWNFFEEVFRDVDKILTTRIYMNY